MSLKQVHGSFDFRKFSSALNQYLVTGFFLVNSVLTACERTLRVDSVFCWSDSQIALWWIWCVNREFKQFVQNRVVEIRGLVNPAHWDYCPNPADICSRGSLAFKLVANQLWWNGLEFLLKGKESWSNLSVNPEVTSTEPDTWLQLKKESSSSPRKQRNNTILANIVAVRVKSERKLNLNCIIPLKRSTVYRDQYELPYMSCSLRVTLRGKVKIRS